ncbi:MAG: hypothetical protein HOC71_05110 [Candidatus Latescibacteria bacterium]|nr:hypothetical protein [Candidatus Latescibacterota bacterium]
MRIPSANINSGQLTFDYTFLPNSVAIKSENVKSENWIFSSSLGFFPFLECYFSVIISPQYNVSYGIPNYGSEKVRSWGAKLKIINESNSFPTVAIGLHDPNLKSFGASISIPNSSATFLVMTKQIIPQKISLSVGYGNDIFKGSYSRFNGIFGGVELKVNKNVSLLFDYDAEYWSEGISIQWRRINAVCGLVDLDNIAFRVGFDINLLNK